MPEVEFQTSAGSTPGYMTLPNTGHGPATIVLQERCGVDGHIRSICDRLAAEGFYALAPDLDPGDATSQPRDAEQKMIARSMDLVKQDMCGAADFLLSQPGFEGPGVAAIGFSHGGGLALWAAGMCPNVAAAVTYYSVMSHGKPDFTRIDGPVLGHFGTADTFISLKDAKTLETEMRTAGVDVIFDKYTGAGHAFFNETNRLDTYDEDAAERSWERSMTFLRDALSTPKH